MLVVEQAAGLTYLVKLSDSSRMQVSQFGGPIVASALSQLTSGAGAVIGSRSEARARHIRRVEPSGGAVTELAAFASPVLVGVTELTPDDSRLTLSLGNYEGSSELSLFDLNLSTGAIVPLLQFSNGRRPGLLQWFSDGVRYLASVSENGLQDIRLFSRTSQSSAGTAITGTQCDNIPEMELSRDGRYLLYTCIHYVPGTSVVRTEVLRSYGIDGSRPVVLPSDFRGYSYVFSPDARFLAYTSPDDRQVWLLRLATGERRRAFTTDALVAEVADWK